MAMGNKPVALITGGSKRVGAAIAQRMASAGFDIAITYLSSSTEAEKLVGKIRIAGAEAMAIRTDFNEPSECAATISHELLQKFGRLDLLVNNASMYRPSALRDTDTATVTAMMNVHFITPMLLCRDFEKTLRENRGSVVNMLDATAEKPNGKYLAYTASKAALANLTLALARDLAPEVCVNGIAPGVVEWPPDFPLAEQEAYLQRVPLKRAGTPGDVAELVAFLATKGKYITGQILKLDGGRSIA